MPDATSKKLVWNQTGEKHYQTGVSKMAFFKQNADGTYPLGIAWNGITSVSLTPSGAEESPFYADNIKWLSLRSAEQLGGTIEAYDSPDEFDECDGTKELAPGVSAGQQTRVPFGFAFESIEGNDTQFNDYGTNLHLVYNATASPSERAYQTVSDSPEPTTLSWEVSTTPLEVGEGFKPTSRLTFNSKKTSAALWKKITDAVYGTDTTDPYLPLPSEIYEWCKSDAA